MKKIGSTVAEGVADRLRDEIRSGSIRPGEFLRQNAVAERLGVSSTPVREALAILEREGIVRRETHRGVVVFEPSVEDLFDCYEIRETLEVLAAQKAAKLLTDEDLKWLKDLAERMPKTTDTAEYMRMNEAFHERIERAAGNPRLFDLIAAQRVAAMTYLHFLGLEPSARLTPAIADEHQAIVDALLLRRPDAAGLAMSRHLRERAATLRDRLLGSNLAAGASRNSARPARRA